MIPLQAALCVGGMVVARAMDQREFADDLRKSCMAVAFKPGGWRLVLEPISDQHGTNRMTAQVKTLGET